MSKNRNLRVEYIYGVDSTLATYKRYAYGVETHIHTTTRVTRDDARRKYNYKIVEKNQRPTKVHPYIVSSNAFDEGVALMTTLPHTERGPHR